MFKGLIDKLMMFYLINVYHLFHKKETLVIPKQPQPVKTLLAAPPNFQIFKYSSPEKDLYKIEVKDEIIYDDNNSIVGFFNKSAISDYRVVSEEHAMATLELMSHFQSNSLPANVSINLLKSTVAEVEERLMSYGAPKNIITKLAVIAGMTVLENDDLRVNYNYESNNFAVVYKSDDWRYSNISLN